VDNLLVEIELRLETLWQKSIQDFFTPMYILRHSKDERSRFESVHKEIRHSAVKVAVHLVILGVA